MKIFQPFLVAAGLLCVAAPAFAGHWDVDESSPIDGIMEQKDTTTWSQYGPWSEDEQYFFEEGNSTHSGTFNLWTSMENGEVQSTSGFNSKGTVQLSFVWVPDNSNDPAPDTLGIAESSEVIAYFSPGGPVIGTMPAPNSTAHGSGLLLDNGLGASIGNYTPYGMTTNSGRRASSTVITWYPVEDGKVDLPVRNLRAQVDGHSTSASGYLGIQMGYYARQDNRKVILSRNVNNTNYPDREKTVYENGIPVTYGATTFSYALYNYPQTVRNTQAFSAVYSGGWSNGAQNPNVTWNWYPDNKLEDPGDLPLASITASRWNVVPLGGLEKDVSPNPNPWMGTSTTPVLSVLDYVAVDNSDGARFTAKYVMEIHDPIEIVSSDIDGISYITDAFDSSGNPYKIQYSSPGPTITGSQYTNAYSSSNGFSLSGTLGGISIYGYPLGVEVGYEHSSSSSITMEPENQGYVLQPGEYCNIVIRHTYNRHHVLFWHYMPEGKDKRMVAAPPDGHSNEGQMEVPHEAIWDVFNGDVLAWSPPKQIQDGYPTLSTTQPSIPEKSYSYS